MSRRLPPRLVRLAGPTPLVRRLSTQSVLSAFGDGVFLTGSAVFTQVVGLSAARVGLGLTIAGVVTFLVAVPLGKLSDRFGAKRVWAVIDADRLTDPAPRSSASRKANAALRLRSASRAAWAAAISFSPSKVVRAVSGRLRTPMATLRSTLPPCSAQVEERR